MLRNRIDQLLADYRAAAAGVKQDTHAVLDAEDRENYTLEAQSILQSTAVVIQQKAHDRIAGVVSRCLEAVFDDPYEFKIQFVQKRGKTEANLLFVRRGLVLEDPINSVGGGVLDVAAFALRVACLVLEKPLKRRLLVLDEPFSRLRGQQNRERMRDLVESLAEDFGVQFVLNIDISQFPEFLMGTVVELGVS